LELSILWNSDADITSGPSTSVVLLVTLQAHVKRLDRIIQILPPGAILSSDCKDGIALVQAIVHKLQALFMTRTINNFQTTITLSS